MWPDENRLLLGLGLGSDYISDAPEQNIEINDVYLFRGVGRTLEAKTRP